MRGSSCAGSERGAQVWLVHWSARPLVRSPAPGMIAPNRHSPEHFFSFTQIDWRIPPAPFSPFLVRGRQAFWLERLGLQSDTVGPFFLLPFSQILRGAWNFVAYYSPKFRAIRGPPPLSSVLVAQTTTLMSNGVLTIDRNNSPMPTD